VPIAFGEDRYIGRPAELEELAHLIRAVQDGSGSLLLVSGDAGMGKTRLAEEAGRLARAAGLAVSWGQCAEAEGAPPYLPWTQVFNQLSAGSPLTRIPDWRKPAEEQGSRFQLFEEALEAMREVSTRSPVVVILDDVQWADAASLHLLQYAASQLPSLPVMVLANHRDPEEASELATILPSIGRQRGVRRLPLRPLTASEGDELARRALGGQADWEVVASIQRRAEGNPLFIRELANLLSEPRPSSGELPRTVREVIRSRLLNLDPEVRNLLREAAVLGVEFDPRLLRALAGLSQVAIEDLLLDAERRRLVAGDKERQRFSHGLIQEVLYGELSTRERTRLHAEAARALKQRSPDFGDHRAEVVAHHLRQALPLVGPGEALMATLEAADDAESALAHEDAAIQLALAAELASLAGLPVAQRHALQLRLGRCRFRAGAITSAWEACRAVAADARDAGDWSTVAEAATLIRGVAAGAIAAEIDGLCVDALAALPAADLSHRAKLLAQRVLVADPWALSRDQSLSTAALRAAEASGDPDSRFMALQAHKQELLNPQYCLERLSAGDRALRLAQESGRGEYAVWGHVCRIGALWELGRRAQLDGEIAALTAVVDRLKEPLHRWQLRLIKAAIARMEGRFAEAVLLLDSALEIGRAVGHQEAEVLDRVARAYLLLETGGSDELAQALQRREPTGTAGFFAKLWEGVVLSGSLRIEELRRLWPTIVDRFAVFPPNIAWIDAVAAMANMCCLVEDRGFAASLYTTLLPFADYQAVSVGGGGSAGPVALYLGKLAGLLGQWEDAEAWLQQAISSCQSMASAPTEAFARHALAAVWIERGRPRDRAGAAHEIEQAAAIASHLGMRPLEARIGRVIENFRQTDPDGRLTGRELEVARLVALGLSNQAIAQRLHLSPRTAENHVQHIPTKLDFDSRSQIAAWFAARKIE